VSSPGEENAFSAAEVTAAADELSMRAEQYTSVLDAVRDIIEKSESDSGRILICGSLYLAGHVLKDNG